MISAQMTLGEVLTLQRGFDITRAQQAEGSVPVVSSSGINSYHSVAMVQGPGVVIGRKGTLGTCFFLDRPFWPHDTTLWVKDFKGNDPRFCFYLLKSMNLAKYDVGAANPTLNRNHVHLLPAFRPLLKQQRRIASILGAYDDLIDVNRRRIAVLEEMARRLFEEWFVHCGFPGRCDSTDGSKWTTSTLGELTALMSGFAFKSQSFSAEGEHRLVTIKNVQDGLFIPSCDSRLDDIPSQMPEHCKLKTGDLLLSLTGNVGRVCIVFGGSFLLNQRVALLSPRSPGEKWFVYCYFRQDGFRRKLEQTSNGVAQQNLSPVMTAKLPVSMPPKELRTRFSEAVEPMFQQVILLSEMALRLSASRDLLLPRLISGELSVSAAEDEFRNAA